MYRYINICPHDLESAKAGIAAKAMADLEELQGAATEEFRRVKSELASVRAAAAERKLACI